MAWIDAADDVGDEHDHLPREAVRPHASGQDEDDEWQRLGGEHDPEVGRRAVERLDDRECERDRDEPVAESRGRLPEPEEPEPPLAESSEQLARVHVLTLRVAFGARPDPAGPNGVRPRSKSVTT